MGMLGQALGAMKLFYGRAAPIQWPAPLPIKAYPTELAFIPDLSVSDGSGWVITTTLISRVGPTGAVIYTITPSTDINASATHILAIWPDYTAGRLYMLAYGGTTTWLCYTTLASKAMTVRGTTGVLINSSSILTTLVRQANGDFVHYATTSSRQSPILQRAAITEATGAQAAATTLLHGGVSVGVWPTISGTSLAIGGFYITQDEALTAHFSSIGGSLTDGLVINRGGRRGLMPHALTSEPYDNRTAAIFYNDTAVTIAPCNGFHAGVVNSKHYNRAEFDTFLHACADRLGLPR